MNEQELINELEYYNFEYEFEVILCSYLLTLEGESIFNSSSKALKLYIDKLYYIGINIDDYSDLCGGFDKKVLRKKTTKEEVRDYLLAYIALQINLKEKGNRKEIERTTQMICEKYISSK